MMASSRTIHASSSSLIIDWHKVALLDCEITVKKNMNAPVIPLPMIVRIPLWRMSVTAELNKEAIASVASRVLEQYFYYYFRTIETLRYDPRSMSVFKNGLSKKIILLMAAALSISAKYHYSNDNFKDKILKATAMFKSLHTASELAEAEFEMFHTINFIIPVWATLDLSWMLAAQIGLMEREKVHLQLITSVSELYRIVIDNAVKKESQEKVHSPSGKHVINYLTDLHLAAGCVTVCRVLSHSELSQEEYVPKLACLTCVTTNYINLIAKSIIHYFNLARESGVLEALLGSKYISPTDY